MNAGTPSEIVIQGAKTNNLKNVSLKIPHNQFIVVTGISGSGKSSLVFEIMAKEGQRRYFETLPSFARQFMGKLNRPDVDEIEGLSPVIAIGQRTTGMHARSTVGTLSDLYDLLRLLFARTGKTESDIPLSRALFSFNSEVGKCSHCNGIGKKEEIDLNRLVVHPEKTLREGALAPTLPNGYIMYSQVTIDVLNQVCEAEGFNVDIPWNQLTAKQQKVILYGSEKIKVPFGKHSLESRLKWTGIKAKPREEGFYKGMIPIMSDILRRDRNANILKYVHSVTCPECQGTRLNSDTLSVTVHGLSIAEVTRLELHQLQTWLRQHAWAPVAKEIIDKILDQVEILEDLGLGHLTLDRPSSSLRASEIQRIRVANQLLVPLSNVLYVFDEPSIGLHREENERLVYHLKQLVRRGNTVIVVEHDLDTISSADHIIEMGPKAGIHGGQIVYNGAYKDFITRQELDSISPTLKALQNHHTIQKRGTPAPLKNQPSLTLIGCTERNLKNIDVMFQLGKLNVVSGRSGVGKSSLVKDTLLRTVRQHLGLEHGTPAKIKEHRNLDAINKLIFVDHSPIGKTPRSNPATYLGLSDHIRDLFASLPEAKERKYTKSRFSFNTSARLSASSSTKLSASSKGGRCETCQGAGKIQIGMHFLGNVDLVCSTCNGDRFNAETLEIQYKGLSIADIYRLSVDEALSFFEGQKKILSGLHILQEIGLGYLKLGQSSTTLSGGEAQRIKIANQLQKKDTGDTLYIIVEPSIGLHPNDIQSLLQLFDRIQKKGNTIVCMEQNETIIQSSDWHIELGPQSGSAGGEIIHQGLPKPKTTTSPGIIQREESEINSQHIVLNGITTHGLKNIDVRIPKNQLTVVTGVSGSGKSSLVYDTLFAESNARFTESLSTYNRSFIQQNSEAVIESFSGLGPAIGIHRKGGAPSIRSTVGTLSGIYDAFRLLYSRIAQQEGKIYTAQHYSFNHHLGACPVCEGLGEIRTCDPDQIIVAPAQSIWEGAISTNKAVAYYADPNGQFMATLKTVAQHKSWDLSRPWQELETEIQETILYGTGDTIWEVTWEYITKTSSGTQELKAKWLGLCHYIDDEYQRRRHNKNIQALEDLLHHVECTTCHGSRLQPELLQTQFLGKNIHEWTQLSISTCLELLQTNHHLDATVHAISRVVLPTVMDSLHTIEQLGLGYLNLNRSVHSLSGGERQRITLAGQLASHLFGVTYVLDEPTIGLDQEQVNVLSKVLKQIIANGNTVIVVEHDLSFIKTADYLIEMGPGAGNLGGEVIYQGQFKNLDSVQNSVTYQALQLHHTPIEKTKPQKGDFFGLKGAFANNLKSIDVDFHSQQIIAVTGVSGSGKSSLIKEVLHASWIKNRPVYCDSVYGLQHFDEVLLMNQETGALTRLTTPLSYTGIIEPIKALFAKTETAKSLGFKKADFSYQSKKGKCMTCNGHGKVKTSMDFMSDIWLTCDTCSGKRYNDSILSCKLNGKSIGDVLQMTVLDAIAFFESEPFVKSFEILEQVGIGHLQLGQSGNTLSEGEVQRLKLAKSMLSTAHNKNKKLYLFDEPSTGLHYFDLIRLIEVFQKLVNDGHTVLFIEHNATLIESAHQVIRLGPGSGPNGGELI